MMLSVHCPVFYQALGTCGQADCRATVPVLEETTSPERRAHSHGQRQKSQTQLKRANSNLTSNNRRVRMPKLATENECTVDCMCCEAVPIARVWMFAVRTGAAFSKRLFFRFCCSDLFGVKIAPNDTTIRFSRGRSTNQVASSGAAIERIFVREMPDEDEAEF